MADSALPPPLPVPARLLARQLADDKRLLGEGLFRLAVRMAHDPHLSTRDPDRITLDIDPQPVTAALLACPELASRPPRPTDLAARTAAVTATIQRLYAGRMAREDARLPAGEVAPREPLPGPFRLPHGTLEERLQRRLAAEIRPWLRQCYDYDVTGSLEVRVSREPQAVGISAEVGCARRFPVAYTGITTHAARVVRYVLTLPSAWWRRVKRPGLILVEGQVTLDAEPLAAPADAELFAVTSIRQGQGQRLHTAHGVLARDVATRITAVAGDAERALRLLRQRCPAPVAPPEGRAPRVIPLRRGPVPPAPASGRSDP